MWLGYSSLDMCLLMRKWHCFFLFLPTTRKTVWCDQQSRDRDQQFGNLFEEPANQFGNLFEECKEETETNSVCQPQSTTQNSASAKKKKKGKRKHADSPDSMVELMGTYCRNTDVRLAEIAKRIGYEYDISIARKEVFGLVAMMQGLSLQEKLLVSKLLVKNTEDLELFFSLPDEAKIEFAKMKLAGNL